MFSRPALILLTLFLGSVTTNGHPAATCPAIEITGPAGIIQPGDTMMFTANVGDKDTNTIEYNWLISAGTIVAGQGTPTITVQTDRSIRGEILASVTLKGLPPGCKNSASQRGVVDCVGDPPLIDEYGALKQRPEMARLEEVLVELRSRPGWLVYIIEYSVPERSKKARVNWMTSYFRSKKIPPDQLVFVSGGRHPSGRRTKIYLAPPMDHCLSPKS